MSDTVVIYHGGCSDGFCAAWLLHQHFPNAEFVPAHYRDEPPDVSRKHVYVVDFSYPRETLLRMYDDAASLVVLDHHKTAKKELEGLPFCVFDEDKSGARLTHEYIDRAILGRTNGFLSRPHWLVLYTEDRDLWRWELDESRAINASLRSYPLDFDLWDDIASWDEDELEPVIAEGNAILRSQQQIVDAKVQQAHVVKVDRPQVSIDNGWHFWSRWKVANATTLISETAQSLAEETGIGCCWFEKPDGNRIYSLRALKESNIDVSDVAKSFGGGGHAKAAGFESATHPWVE